MNRVRPFHQEDFHQVAQLHHGVMGTLPGQPLTAARLQDYYEYFETIFLNSPSFDEAFPSLVYEEPGGRITGFLGVRSHRLRFKGQPINVATSSQFVVAPDSRATGAGVQILKTFLAGPQDLSLTDGANNTSRKLWEGLKGTTAQVYSMHWTKILWPTQYGLHLWRERGLWSALAVGVRPFCQMGDRLAARRFPHHFQFKSPTVQVVPLEAEVFLQCLQEAAQHSSLSPDYNEHGMRWMLETLATKQGWGTLRKHLILDSSGKILGWYLYYLKPAGVSTVLHFQASKRGADIVLKQLFYDAWKQGSVAISGRLEPKFMQEFSDQHCLFNAGNPWMLINSYDNDLLQTIQRGDAMLSMLEGEWCMRFPKPNIL